MHLVRTFLALIILGLSGLCACADRKSKVNNERITNEATTMKKSFNPVVYFEIPVTDMERALAFYKGVFNFEFEMDVIDKNEMALFPFYDNSTGISGALAKGDIYKPTIDGTLIYFRTDNIDKILSLVEQNGGHILYPKTSNGELGFVAEFEDSEGNRIALYMTQE